MSGNLYHESIEVPGQRWISPIWWPWFW